MDDKITKIRIKLEKELDKDRFQHTLGVMYTSAAMAMHFLRVFFMTVPNAFPEIKKSSCVKNIILAYPR